MTVAAPLGCALPEPINFWLFYLIMGKYLYISVKLNGHVFQKRLPTCHPYGAQRYYLKVFGDSNFLPTFRPDRAIQAVFYK